MGTTGSSSTDIPGQEAVIEEMVAPESWKKRAWEVRDVHAARHGPPTAEDEMQRFARANGMRKVRLEGGNDAMAISIGRELSEDYKVIRKPHGMWVLAGLIAMVVALVAAIYQIVVIIDRQSACDFTLFFLYGTAAVQFLWFLYAASHQYALNAVSSLAGIVTLGVIIGLKYKYDTGNRCEQSSFTGVTTANTNAKIPPP